MKYAIGFFANKLWKCDLSNQLTVTEIALYFLLVKLASEHGKTDFTATNRLIMFMLSISYNTLKKSRERLKELGLINFESKTGCTKVHYRLSVN